MDQLKEEFENKRKEFLRYFKRIRLINVFVILIAIAIFVAVFIIFRNKNQSVALITAIVIVVGLFVYLNSIKKNINHATYRFIRDYYEMTTKTVLNNNGIDNFEILENDTITIDHVKNARIMKDVNYVRDRNNVEFRIDNKIIQMADLLFKIPATNQKNGLVAFCGKYLQFKSDKTFDGRTLIYRKTTVPNCYGPTDIDGLEKVIEDSDLLVYSSNKNFEKEIEKNILKEIRQIKVDDHLYDITFSIRGNDITIAMSYADSIMVIPLYKEIDVDGFKKFNADFSSIKEIIGKL